MDFTRRITRSVMSTVEQIRETLKRAGWTYSLRRRAWFAPTTESEGNPTNAELPIEGLTMVTDKRIREIAEDI